MTISNSDFLRLSKAISDTGYCSRREADRLIEQGRVTINGKIGVLGEKVSAGDSIAVDGITISVKEKPVYIIFNKPVGIICTCTMLMELLKMQLPAVTIPCWKQSM